MRVCGVIVAGGKATRMGGNEKPLIRLAGRPLVDHVVIRVRPQVAQLALNVKESVAPSYRETAARGLPVLADAFHGGAGPIGGVLAGLEWAAAHGHAWLATFPADTPFLPLDLIDRLTASKVGDAPVVAVAGGRYQPLCALWPADCRADIAEGVSAGRYRSLWWTLERLRAVPCSFEDGDAFFNINTDEDLALAERGSSGGR